MSMFPMNNNAAEFHEFDRGSLDSILPIFSLLLLPFLLVTFDEHVVELQIYLSKLECIYYQSGVCKT
jgi:hypothetical protein